ncbi:hypothetical protein FRB94_008999 [Tulasnella sp. JGI-2019a]|nr:hypothetical protein FRB93_003472 [Tulasnella sp. JGI-2019a]KAG9014841.1 hypothetical protein FRB94_008999 [Tulasnella sp. JGI-2019a]KAG9039999.1 hypothetical protein FRB95_004471 [Tulasnella sp. JGI-2019a]
MARGADVDQEAAFKRIPLIILLLPGSIYIDEWEREVIEKDGPCSQGSYFLDIAAEYFKERLDSVNLPRAATITAVISDFQNAVVIEHDAPYLDERIFRQEIFDDLISFPLKHILTSGINRSLYDGCKSCLDINTPPEPTFQGALNNPKLPKPTLSEIIESRTSHSDFDVYALMRDQGESKKFIEWKREHQTRALSRPVLVGDTMTGIVNGFVSRTLDLQAVFPHSPSYRRHEHNYPPSPVLARCG